MPEENSVSIRQYFDNALASHARLDDERFETVHGTLDNILSMIKTVGYAVAGTLVVGVLNLLMHQH